MIALDEAFAGVDDKNISSMFELVHKLDFDYIMNLIEVQKTMDIDNILESLKVKDKSNIESNITVTYKVDKIFSLDRIAFKKLCQNLMRSKFSNYVIVQEYTDTTHPANNNEEINYLTYSIKGSKKDLTLVSFKRWQKTEIGELMIRDFLMMVSESGAKNGILIAPVELSGSAKNPPLDKAADSDIIKVTRGTATRG